MRRRPVVHQFTAVLAGRDAVGQHTLAVDDLLRGLGCETGIFATHVHPEVKRRGRLFHDHDAAPAADLLIYQMSTGSPVAEYLAGRPEPLVLNYHNVTPAEMFDPWEPHIGAELDQARRELAMLARRATAGVAVSEYNAAELRNLGIRDVVVAPVLFELSAGSAGRSDAAASAKAASVSVASDGELLGGSAVSSAASDSDSELLGGSAAPTAATILFVGRVAPNKCHEDLISAFAVVRRSRPEARLVLVGGVSSEGYRAALVGLARRLGVADGVVFAGSVSGEELVGWYRAADVFLCLSEHEGFGVPLVEAMGFGVPVVAFGAAAVPETVGDGGLVLGVKDPVSVGLAVDRVLSDVELRSVLVEAGRERAAVFAGERSRDITRQVFERLISELAA